ncbi:MAG: hypothetical protein ACM3MG_05660 [Bacillota bacterium]
MKKVLLLIGTVMLLSSCATLRKKFCDCDCTVDIAEKKRPVQVVHPVKATKTVAKGKAGIVVEQADIDAADRMTKAVDAYVFNNQSEEFTALCKEERFDCFVDEKRFPKDKKRVKRSVPPFLSGSKMGLQGDKRVKIKYDFYP